LKGAGFSFECAGRAFKVAGGIFAGAGKASGWLEAVFKTYEGNSSG